MSTPETRRIRKEVIEERAVCSCGGDMRATGNALPGGYWHICAVCKKVTTFDKQYPRVIPIQVVETT